MLGVKLTKDRLGHILRNAKSHLHHGYHQTKHILGQIDRGVSNAKKLYAIVEPIVRELAGSHHHKIHRHVMNGMSGYEKIRKGIIEGHDEVIHHVNHVGKKLVNLGIN